MSSLVIRSQCANCFHNLRIKVNVPEELRKGQEEKSKIKVDKIVEIMNSFVKSAVIPRTNCDNQILKHKRKLFVQLY